jgi:hypothetical protein
MIFRRKPQVVTGTLRIMSKNGDDVMTWNKNDKNSVAEVKALFDEMIRVNKMWAYTVPAQGEAELIRDFDPDAELIKMHKQNIGG